MQEIRRRWHQLDSAFAILLALFLLQCLLLLTAETPNWDAAFYYVYARSAAFDGDLELAEDLRLSYPTAGAQFAAKQVDAILTGTGRVVSVYAIGSSIIWLPMLALLRLVLAVPAGLGWISQMNTGYEGAYVGAISALSALLGFIAFWLTYRFSRDIVGRRPALIGTATLMFTTPLLYYQFREPLYAHATSAFIMAVCIIVWYRQAETLPLGSRALLLGGLFGLGILVRWQHAVYCILPALSAALWWLRLPAAERKRQWKHPLVYLLLVAGVTLLVVSLQMAKWRVFDGQWITVPQGEAFMNWTAPNVMPVLASTYRGLLAWMPLSLFAVIGLVWLARRHPQLAFPLLLVLSLEIYVAASTVDWYGGGGYGVRRFTGALIIFGLGYAGFLAIFRPRPQLLISIPLGLLLVWQQWVLLRFGLEEQIGGRNLSGYPTFAWEQVSWPAYFRQLTAHIPDLWENPRALFLFPGSPLYLLVEQERFPWNQFIGLLAAALFVLGVVWLARRLQPRGLRPWLIGAGLLLVIANAWMLWFA